MVIETFSLIYMRDHKQNLKIMLAQTLDSKIWCIVKFLYFQDLHMNLHMNEAFYAGL